MKRANAVFHGQLKKQKRESALEATQHKEPISDLDMVKLKAYFEKMSENPTPVSQTEQVWFALTNHLSFRGRETQASLKKNDLLLSSDKNGEFLSRSWVSRQKITLVAYEIQKREMLVGYNIRSRSKQSSFCSTQVKITFFKGRNRTSMQLTNHGFSTFLLARLCCKLHQREGTIKPGVQQPFFSRDGDHSLILLWRSRSPHRRHHRLQEVCHPRKLHKADQCPASNNCSIS